VTWLLVALAALAWVGLAIFEALSQLMVEGLTWDWATAALALVTMTLVCSFSVLRLCLVGPGVNLGTVTSVLNLGVGLGLWFILLSHGWARFKQALVAWRFVRLTCLLAIPPYAAWYLFVTVRRLRDWWYRPDPEDVEAAEALLRGAEEAWRMRAGRRS